MAIHFSISIVHCTAIPDKLITIKCWWQQGAPYAAGKKNEASRWSDSRIFQLTSKTEHGHIVACLSLPSPVSRTSSASVDLPDLLQPCPVPTQNMISQFCRERGRESSSRGTSMGELPLSLVLFLSFFVIITSISVHQLGKVTLDVST